MGLVLLDSSAVIGYLDRDDLLNAHAVERIEHAIRGGSGLAISAISWAELLRGAMVGHRDEQAVRDFVADLGIGILPVDAAVAERAAELQTAYRRRRRGAGAQPAKLRTPDALILATADLERDVEAIICGDEQWPKVPGVRPRVELVRERR